MSEEDENIDIRLEDNKINSVVFTEKIKNRIFSSVLNLTECVQVICIRADQIDTGAKIFVASRGGGSSYEIAIREIIEGKCPLAIIRSRGTRAGIEYVEKWSVNELEKSEQLLDKIETIFDRSEKYNIKNKLYII